MTKTWLVRLFYILPKLCGTAIELLFIAKCLTLLQTSLADIEQTNQGPPKFTFEDFNRKYEPRVIWEEIDKKTSVNNTKLSTEDTSRLIFNRLDPTDELLSFKVGHGDPKLISEFADGRRWRALKHQYYTQKDPFDVRRRLMELMKQAIYEARNKLIIMQTMRPKYRNTALYKMGFLFSRTDAACKQFYQFSYKAFRACIVKRHDVPRWNSLQIFHILQMNERQLQLWLNVQMLVDLIKLNDNNFKRVLRQNTTNRKKAWKFVDK